MTKQAEIMKAILNRQELSTLTPSSSTATINETPDTVLSGQLTSFMKQLSEASQSQATQGRDLSMSELVATFRRLFTEANPKRSRAAFAATLGKASPTEESGDDGRQIKKSKRTPCICGAQHKYEDCWTLIPSKAPEGWTPKDPIKTKIIKALAGNQRLALQVQKALDKSSLDLPDWVKQASKSSKSPAKSAETASNASTSSIKPAAAYALSTTSPGGGFTACTTKSSYKAQKPLHLFKLDSCADTHICNDLERFTSFRPDVETSLTSGGITEMVQGIGTVPIMVQGPDGPTPIKLLNVLYAPAFAFNLVSYQRMRLSGARWNDTTGWIEERGHKAYKVHYHDGWPIIEMGVLSRFAMAVKGRKPSSIASFDTWHQRMGHASIESISHLPSAVRGVVLATTRPAGDTDFCRQCVLGQIHAKPSRISPFKGDYPFEKVHFDVVPFEEASDGNQHLFQFYCAFSKFRFSFLLPKKDAKRLVEVIQEFLSITKTWGFTVRYFQSDSDPTFNGRLTDYIRDQGIVFNQAPADTQDQNGFAERSGRTVIETAIKIGTATGLPATLWPYFVTHATMVLNRLPTRGNDWITPFEKVHGRQAEGSGYRILGSKAYVLIKSNRANDQIHRQKLQKLHPKAVEGWLVGMASSTGSNIYKVWLPQYNHRIIISRDVRIDEKIRFKAEEHDESIPPIPQSALAEVDIDDESLSEEALQVIEQLSFDTVISKPPDSGPSYPTPPETAHSPSEMPLGDAQVLYESPPSPAASEYSHISVAQAETPVSGVFSESYQGALEQSIGRTDPLSPASGISPTGGESPASDLEQESTPVQHGMIPLTIPQLDEEMPDRADTPSAQLSLKPSSSLLKHLQLDEAGPSSRLSQSTPETPGPICARMHDLGDAPMIARGKPQSPALQTDITTSNPAPKQWKTNPEVTAVRQLRSSSGRTIKPSRKAQSFDSKTTVPNEALGKNQTPPGVRRAFAMAASSHKRVSELQPPPDNWKVMLRHPEATGFIQAAQVEIDQLRLKGTWEEVPRPSNKQILPLRWVFSYKSDELGYLSKYKARICVRGDLQFQTDNDYYAATGAYRSFRILMGLVCAFDLNCDQVDVKNAFTNALMDEEVYCYSPQGFETPGKVIRLLKALYGLRRSPKLWYDDITAFLCALGFKPCPEDPCVLTRDTDSLIIFLFVDDMLLMGRPQHQSSINEIKTKLNEKYGITDLGEAKTFLNIRITRDRGQRKLWLTQDSYVDKLVVKFGLEGARKVFTPLPSNYDPSPFEGNATEGQIKEYQQKIGSLIYPSVVTRPDIAFATSNLSRFLTNPGPDHIRTANRLISYLDNTKGLSIEYSGDTEVPFLAASDASFADDKTTRRSTQGFLMTLYGGPIDWVSQRQKTVTTSTTEAELLSVSTLGARVIALWRLFKQIEYDPDQMPEILCDNQQTVGLIQKELPQLTTRLRHVDIHHHWLRQEYRDNKFQISWVPTADMPADGFTKALSRDRHANFVRQLGMVDLTKRLGHRQIEP